MHSHSHIGRELPILPQINDRTEFQDLCAKRHHVPMSKSWTLPNNTRGKSIREANLDNPLPTTPTLSAQHVRHLHCNRNNSTFTAPGVDTAITVQSKRPTISTWSEATPICRKYPTLPDIVYLARLHRMGQIVRRHNLPQSLWRNLHCSKLCRFRERFAGKKVRYLF